jgi:hypothetical protein
MGQTFWPNNERQSLDIKTCKKKQKTKTLKKRIDSLLYYKIILKNTIYFSSLFRTLFKENNLLYMECYEPYSEGS